ncbi:MAG: hypothetical protein WCO96_05650 [Actinomycetes bacterium]
MSRTILALVLATVAFSALSVPMGASAAQSGLTGDPWVDQYIEQIPTASGGKPSNGPSKGIRSGLSSAQIVALANAGGDRFAAAAALAVAPLPSAGQGSEPGSARGSRSSSGSGIADDTQAAGTAAVLFDAIKGSDDGLGPVLPGVLILSLVGAVAFAIVRGRRGRDSGA